MDAGTRKPGRWQELAGWGRERELNELDALMWRTERHPANSWTGLILLSLDTVPDWDELREAHEWMLALVPRFRERVVDPALAVGMPAWSPDPAFALDYHLRRLRLPEPGSTKQLLEYAQALALTPLDRTRPPWTGTLVEGLEDGRAAFLLQAHHVMMDGMAVTQLLARVLSHRREARPLTGLVPNETLAPVRSVELSRREIVRQVTGTPGAVGSVARELARAVAHPRRSTRYARSLARVLSPPPASTSRLLEGGSRRIWRFGKFGCELSCLRAAGKSVGGTVNDTFVSVLLGALHDYCADAGEEIGDLPISMPVAMRTAGEAMGGNSFAAAFFGAPAGVRGTEERIRELHRRVDQVRSEPALNFLGQLTPILNRVPSPLAAGLLGSVNERSVLTTSSWPGVPTDVYAAGAKIDGMWVFAPLPGTTLTGAMCTHAGKCCIAVNVDGEVIGEPDRLWSHIQANLDQVLALAGASPETKPSSASRNADGVSNIG